MNLEGSKTQANLMAGMSGKNKIHLLCRKGKAGWICSDIQSFFGNCQ